MRLLLLILCLIPCFSFQVYGDVGQNTAGDAFNDRIERFLKSSKELFNTYKSYYRASRRVPKEIVLKDLDNLTDELESMKGSFHKKPLYAAKLVLKLSGHVLVGVIEGNKIENDNEYEAMAYEQKAYQILTDGFGLVSRNHTDGLTTEQEQILRELPKLLLERGRGMHPPHMRGDVYLLFLKCLDETLQRWGMGPSWFAHSGIELREIFISLLGPIKLEKSVTAKGVELLRLDQVTNYLDLMEAEQLASFLMEKFKNFKPHLKKDIWEPVYRRVLAQDGGHLKFLFSSPRNMMRLRTNQWVFYEDSLDSFEDSKLRYWLKFGLEEYKKLEKSAQETALKLFYAWCRSRFKLHRYRRKSSQGVTLRYLFDLTLFLKRTGNLEGFKASLPSYDPVAHLPDEKVLETKEQRKFLDLIKKELNQCSDSFNALK